MKTHLKKVAAGMKRLWRAYVEATKHEHEYDRYGECRCGKLVGGW